jgi:hypothetical protein
MAVPGRSRDQDRTRGLTGIGWLQNRHTGSGSLAAFASSTGAPQFGQCVGMAQGGPATTAGAAFSAGCS